MGNRKQKTKSYCVVFFFLCRAGLVFKSNKGTETHFLLASLKERFF